MRDRGSVSDWGVLCMAGNGLTFLSEAVRDEVIAIENIQEQEVYICCYPALYVVHPAAEEGNAICLMHFQPWPACSKHAHGMQAQPVSPMPSPWMQRGQLLLVYTAACSCTKARGESNFKVYVSVETPVDGKPHRL